MFSPRFKVTNPLNKQKLLATHTRQAASSTYTLDNHITMHSVSHNKLLITLKTVFTNQI